MFATAMAYSLFYTKSEFHFSGFCIKTVLEIFLGYLNMEKIETL